MRLFDVRAVFNVSPGHRNYRRMVEGVLRQLTQAAFSARRGLPDYAKARIFTLVPEFATAAIEASTIASTAKITIAMPNETILLPPQLTSMLYLDHLVFGFATFERAGDTVVYSDPTQFTSINLKEDGSVVVAIRDNKDVSDRVGVVTLRLNPFMFGFSVTELIPHTFINLILYRTRLTYSMSHFQKPEIIIVTNEMLSQDEIASRRRQLISQAEDDYGSIIFYAHSGEDKPQIQVLDRPESSLKDFMKEAYEREVEILRRACGCPIDGQISAVMISFLDNLESELERVFPEASVNVGLPELPVG